MLNIRRIYLYLVAAIGLVAVTWSVIGLARLVVSEGIGPGQITGLATMLAVIIVGLPIFLVHWLIAQRLAASSADEREAPIRQVYFFGLMAVGAAPIFSSTYRLLEQAVLALLGGSPPGNAFPYDLTIAEHVITLIVWGVVWLYLWRQLPAPAKSREGMTKEINLTIRRLYLLVFSTGGLVMVAWGAAGLMQTLMESASEILWPNLAASYITQLLLGAGVWLVHWLILQRLFTGEHPAEERSVLRKVYLYLAVFVFSIIALSNGTLLLQRLLELAFGAPPDPAPLLTQLSLPVPWLVVGSVFWAYHWQVLKRDAVQAPEAPRQAGVRRIYAYLLAGVGLVVLLSGVSGLLIELIDWFTSPATVGLDFYRSQIALFISMTVVGLPVWWLSWRSMQQQALKPVEVKVADKSAPTAAYRSLVRKIYLYFFLFVAAVAIFGSVGWFVFHILSALLGADLPDDFLTQVLDAAIISLLAAGVWLYHWWALRRDGQLEAQEQADRLADVSVVVIDGDRGELGRAVIRHFQKELPGVRLEPVGLTPPAVEAMAGQPVSAANFEAGRYIVGSWQTLSADAVAPVVAASQATKFVVPLAEPNWQWVGLQRRSLDSYAEQIVAGVKQSIEGEEVDFGRGVDLSTLIGIVVGVVLFLCVGSNLIWFAVRIF